MSIAEPSSLSVVVPAYNESRRLGPGLETIAAYLEKGSAEHEIIVVDDGSTDDTASVAREVAGSWPRVKVIQHVANRGKGAAVRSGVLASRGDRILFSDADLATPIAEEAKLQAAMDEGYDVVIASRALPESDIQVRQHPLREIMGKTFNRILRVLALTPYADTQCGFKLFTREAGHDLFRQVTIDHFAFDVEILLLARGRYRVAEVPVVWRHMQDSRVSMGTDAARMFLDVLRVRLRMG
jgi:dolichyl-phosphate beta-glucosyltransferase